MIRKTTPKSFALVAEYNAWKARRSARATRSSNARRSGRSSVCAGMALVRALFMVIDAGNIIGWRSLCSIDAHLERRRDYASRFRKTLRDDGQSPCRRRLTRQEPAAALDRSLAPWAGRSAIHRLAPD